MTTRLPRLLTTAAVAEWLGYSTRHVTRLARSGDLPARVVGGQFRFREDHLLAWLERQPTPTVEVRDEPVRLKGSLRPLGAVEL